jgi:N-carbamoylputrescine amidase
MNRHRTVRLAVTQTVNAFSDMPARVADLGELEGRLGELRDANVAHHVELMREAKRQGVQVIGFGELFPGPYFALGKDPMWFGLAEDARSGPTVTTLAGVARELELVVVAPIYEQDPSGRRFNTAVLIDHTGSVLGKYRKTHLPCGENEQGSFDEPFYYDKSDGQNDPGPRNVSKNPFFPVYETRVGKVGVAICYDRHFEGVMYSLAHEGAELVFAPAVTFGQKSQRMWHLEFQVEAARHGLFIAGSNRKGSEPPWNQPYFGESHVTGPNGVLPDVSTHEKLVIAEVELDVLGRPDPSGWNLPRDARYDIYSRRG